MADVFVSYAREDVAKAALIARTLQAQGLEVFWDTEIPPGQTWADFIESKLSGCKAVIVLWSAHSVTSQSVREEARIGRDKGKLIPVLIDQVSVPLGFGEVQTANLIGWSGDRNQPEWGRLSNAVFAAAGVTPRSGPAHSAFQAPPPVYTATSGGDLSPVDYIKKCFALYVDGKGRARRSEYWWFFLFSVILIIVAAVLDVSMFGVNPVTGAANAPLFTSLASLGVLCPSVSVGARRLHDIGFSGWLMAPIIIGYFFLIGGLVMLIVALIPSKPDANQYGPNPKLAPA